MVSLSAAFPPVMESIFSPDFEHNDAQIKPLDQNSAVLDVRPELPNLVSVDNNEGRCAFSDAQNYNFWDFYDSEVTVSPINDDTRLPDVITTGYPDYEHIQCDMLFDSMDKYMVLPSLEETTEINGVQDEKLNEEASMNCDNSCFYLAIHQMASRVETELNYKYSDLEDVECFDPQLFLGNLPDLLESDRPNSLPRETRQRKSVTLVLDLDETLVHSTLKHCIDADFSFPVFFNMELHTVYVKRRPHLQTFLERVANMFEVVIFTASQSIYAEQLLDILDPERKLFSRRMYRDSCIFSDGDYIKDLTVLRLNLAKVAIIDNSPQVFQLQINNGIPITSWFDDPSDQALISLLPFLESLADADDVRPIIANKFGNKE